MTNLQNAKGYKMNRAIRGEEINRFVPIAVVSIAVEEYFIASTVI